MAPGCHQNVIKWQSGNGLEIVAAFEGSPKKSTPSNILYEFCGSGGYELMVGVVWEMFGKGRPSGLRRRSSRS